MANEKKVVVFVFPKERAFGVLGVINGLLSSIRGWLWIVEGSRFVFEAFDEVVSEEVCEREFEIDAFDSFFTDPDPFEE